MNTKRIIVYVLCSFLLMMGVGVLVHFFGVSSAQTEVNMVKAVVGFFLSAGAMMIPLISVIFTQLIFKEPLLKGLDISFKINRWWIIGWLLMPVIALAVLGMSLLMPGVSWAGDSEMVQTVLKQMPEGLDSLWGLVAITLFSGLFAGVTINAVFAFGEEIGWRGYLIKVLQGKKFLTVSLITGVIWGFWHFPLILNGHNYPQHPVAGVFMMVLMCVALTPILLYFRQKSGSVIVAAIMHGTFNAVVGLSNILVTPQNDMLIGGPGLAGFLTLILVNICLYLYDRFISKEGLFSKAL